MKKCLFAGGMLALLLSVRVAAQAQSALEKEVRQFSWGLYDEVKQLPVALDRVSVSDGGGAYSCAGKDQCVPEKACRCILSEPPAKPEAVKGKIPDVRAYKQVGSLAMEEILRGFLMDDSTLNPVYALKTSISAETLTNNMATTFFIMLDENAQTSDEKYRLYGAYVFSGLKLTAQQVSGDLWHIWADGQWRVLDLNWDIRQNKVSGVKVWTKG
ncbi:hypothetical protein MKQ70_07455 [Chitinophaga sedimenti]|uniref:hypothetical protein n=1 Tax=Chitinophaga sedimenti TaxID=2033606 RepID=UPI0020042954|nr:hypothetical protein [Chitinophaga sedimenti]MCK7554848.1 hypothetical protein [Chitinophaga sedimenti]